MSLSLKERVQHDLERQRELPHCHTALKMSNALARGRDATYELNNCVTRETRIVSCYNFYRPINSPAANRLCKSRSATNATRISVFYNASASMYLLSTRHIWIMHLR